MITKERYDMLKYSLKKGANLPQIDFVTIKEYELAQRNCFDCIHFNTCHLRITINIANDLRMFLGDHIEINKKLGLVCDYFIKDKKNDNK